MSSNKKGGWTTRSNYIRQYSSKILKTLTVYIGWGLCAVARDNTKMLCIGFQKRSRKSLGLHMLTTTSLAFFSRFGVRNLAVEHYRRAITINPEYTDAHGNLAAALTELGALKEAFEQFERVLKLRPNHAETHNNLGVLLQRLGQRRDSAAHFQAAIKLDPNYPDALNNLGATFLARQEFENALEYCSRAARLNPSFPEALNNTGNALTRLGRPKEALQYFKNAISLRPDLAEAHNNLGAALDALGDVEQAVGHLKTAAEIDVRYADPHANLAAILLRYGNLDEARQEFEHAARLEPENIKYLLNVAALKRFTRDDPLLNLMEQLSNDTTVVGEERAELHFTLAKSYSDFHEHELASHHMLKANFLKRQQIHYDEKAALDDLRLIQNLFTHELIKQHSGQPNSSVSPIFIVGMPRSGSTLIEQILSSHDGIFGAGEVDLFSEAVERLPRQMGSTSKYPNFAPSMNSRLVTKTQ